MSHTARLFKSVGEKTIPCVTGRKLRASGKLVPALFNFPGLGRVLDLHQLSSGRVVSANGWRFQSL